jgi:hypothetical protein
LLGERGAIELATNKTLYQYQQKDQERLTMTFKRLMLIEDKKLLAQERSAEMQKDGRLGAIVSHPESVKFVHSMIAFEEHFGLGPLLDIKWIKKHILSINGAVSIPFL